jgi:hypothetical protein
MTEEPWDPPTFHEYRHSFVAFLDLLGFSVEVREVVDEAAFRRVSEVVYTLKKEADAMSRAGGVLGELNASAVSDSVIFTLPLTAPKAAYAFIATIHQLQYNLIAPPFFRPIRGFIAEGLVYHKDGILFGPGYMDAYLGEKHLKGPPRVVVAPAIIERAQAVIAAQGEGPGGTTIFEYLAQDPVDALYFIDYLNPTGAIAMTPEIDIQGEHAQIGQFIRASIARFSDDESVASKYRWLEAYWARSPTAEVAGPNEAFQPIAEDGAG